MHPRLVAALVNGAIPFAAGAYFVYAGFGRPRPGSVAARLRERYPRLPRWIGPLLMAFGVFLFLEGVFRP